MGSKEYAFKQLTESEKPQAGSCQRAYCQEASTWKVTIPVKRYNGFARNIALCDRHKVKLEKKISRTEDNTLKGLTPTEATTFVPDDLGELEELE